MKREYSRCISFLMIHIILISSVLPNVSFSNSVPFSSNVTVNGTPAEEKAPYKILIKYKDSKKSKVDFQKIKKNSKFKSVKVKETKVKSKFEVVEIDSEVSSTEVLKEIQKQDNVLYAQEDYKLYTTSVTEPFYYQQWAIYNSGQNILGLNGKNNVDVYAEESWEQSKGSSKTPVAILDTGIDIKHEDLAQNIFINKNEIPNNNIDDDNNGYIDDVNGWNFIENSNNVYSGSEDTHGTHIAGIIAAPENSLGINGAAPESKILVLKFIGENGGYTSSAIEAIEYAKSLGVKIINVSWGSKQYNKALEETIRESGMLFVCAAGNQQTNNDVVPYYPASFDLPNIISVASIDNQGLLSSFSNYGNSVDIAAPGTAIYSTLPNNTYGFLSGTSMAAPFVSATASQLVDLNTNKTTLEIKNDLLLYATRLKTLNGKVNNEALLNAYGATVKNNESPIRPNRILGTTVNETNNSGIYNEPNVNEPSIKDAQFKHIANDFSNQIKLWENKKNSNASNEVLMNGIPLSISKSTNLSERNEVAASMLDTSFYKLKPKFLETNFNSYMSSATVTENQYDFTNMGNFRTNKDLCGISWYAADTISHPELKYKTDSDFTNVKLTYNYQISGYTEPMDSVAGPALTIETNDGSIYYVRLWNYVMNRPLSDWEIGVSDKLNSKVLFPSNRVYGEDNGTRGTIELDFNNLYAGWAPYQWVQTVKGVDEKGEEIIEGNWIEDPGWRKIPVNDIKQIMWTAVPLNYEYGSDEISFLSESMPYEIKFTNWNVTGNAYLGEEPLEVTNGSVGICDDYDDVYNLTPERIVSEYSKLGYKGNVNFYLGASHFYDKQYVEGSMRLIPEHPFNKAFAGWYENYLKLLKNKDFKVIHSISMENLDAPWEWWQKSWDGSPSKTGWTPPTHLLSFTNPDVKAYYKKYVETLIDISNKVSMPPVMQLGEPWWWYNESSNDAVPCFYDQSTRELYLKETGNYMHEFRSIYEDISGHEEMLKWLSRKNGEFTLYLRDIAKQKDSTSEFTVLFFPPSVLDKERIPLMMSLVNFPKEEWKSPNLDFFMLEDYDYLIANQMGKHDETLNFIGKQLGYSNDKIHYLSGFVLNPDSMDVWRNIEQALSDGFSHEFAENYVWAYSQVKRDGWKLPNIVKASFPSGHYSEALEVSLSTKAGLDIYYTTTGLDPEVETAQRYEGPIHVDDDLTIKTAVMENGKLGKITSYNYSYSLSDPILSDIVIDGKDNDWSKIQPSALGSGDIFDLSTTQDETYLYFLARGYTLNTDSNFYIDIDKDSQTGMKVWSWTQSGADYMVANDELYKYAGIGSDWSWTFVGKVSIAKTSNVIEVSLPLSQMGIFDGRELYVGFGRNYSDFSPSPGSKMALSSTYILGENTYLKPGEEYLEYLLKETGASLQGNYINYRDKVYELTSNNSRVVNNRIIIDANAFSNFITSPSQILETKLALGLNEWNRITLAALGSDESGNEVLSSDIFLEEAAYGEYSSNIKRIQLALQKLGYWTDSKTKATGFFGEVTKQSLLNFEKNGLNLTEVEANYVNGDFAAGYTGDVEVASETNFKGIHHWIASILDEISNGKRVTVYSVPANFLLGVTDAAVETVKGVWHFVTHPVESANGICFLVAASVRNSKEQILLAMMIASATTETLNNFSQGNLNLKARYLGRLVGEIILVVIGTKGITQTMDAVKAITATGNLSKMLAGVGKGILTGDDVLRSLSRVAELLKKIKANVSNMLDDISKITRGSHYYEFQTTDGLTFRMLDDEIPAASKVTIEGAANLIKGFKADTAYEAMASGAVDKILSKISVEEFLRLEDLAEKMYDGFRIANDDFAKIANKVKFNADDLKAIKEHLFLKEHKFADGSVRKFDANYWQAEAWERITKGNPIESDFTLLKHELFELNYMKKNNAPYEVAHKKANELYNWSLEVFGE